MSMEVIIGMGVVAFLAAYMMFGLRQSEDKSLTGERSTNKHFLLQLFFLFLFLSSLLFIGNAVYRADTTHCEVVTINQTLSGSTQVNEYERVCYETGYTNGESFYQSVLWVFRLVMAYVVFYFVWEVLKFMNWVVPK